MIIFQTFFWTLSKILYGSQNEVSFNPNYLLINPRQFSSLLRLQMFEVVEPGLYVLQLFQTLLVRQFTMFTDRLRRASVVRYFESWKEPRKLKPITTTALLQIIKLKASF
jgi:hypothetical protein